MGKIRKWNIILHRDIGYLCVGLTIIFAVSGIAVNHIDIWNPNYKIEKTAIQLRLSNPGDEKAAVEDIRSQFRIDEQAESTFKPAPQQLQVFFDQQIFTINLQNGAGVREVVQERVILRDLNFLHLNHAKKIWAYVSDLYALALIFLAVSGIFVLKGKKGFSGRGKWLTGIGFLIPVLFLIIYKYL